MKIADRKVYIADDGSEFDTLEECKLYEFSLRIKEVPILDASLKPCSYYNATYVVIRNDKDVQIIKAYCESYDYYTPWDEDVGGINEDYRGVLICNEHQNWKTIDSEIDHWISLKKSLMHDYPIN